MEIDKYFENLEEITEKEETERPEAVYLDSGSFPSRPTIIVLFMLDFSTH